MGYIGLRTDTSGQYRTIDDISGSFDGSTTIFPLTYSGNPLEVVDPRQLLISIDGVIQEPETVFTTTSTNIVFSVAPGEGSTFWGILLGGTYDVFAQEIQNAVLLNGTYDDTFGPLDGLAIMTANTSGYSDSSTKVATTNFVRQRTIPYFKYLRTTNYSLTHAAITPAVFIDGDLDDSDIITGQTWSSNELTIPSSFCGFWDFTFKFETATYGSAITQLWEPSIEVWNGATWDLEGLDTVTTDTSINGRSLSSQVKIKAKIDATHNKVRCRVYQSNSASSAITVDTGLFEGIYLGGNT